MTYRELTLEFDFPLVKATYGDLTLTDAVPLAVENNLVLQMLDSHEQFEPAHRERVLIEVGQQLFDALIPPAILPIYLRALAEQRQTAATSLRIRIVASDTRLLTLPWEFMYDCRQGVFPASVPETPVVRTLGAVRDGRVFQPVESLRLLLVGASPPDSPRLDYEAEMEAIAGAAGSVHVAVERLPAASASQFRETLQSFQPHILHFMGHGFTDDRGAGILLEDRRLGGSHRIDAKVLTGWMAGMPPRLVVLNACESARLQDAQHRGGLAATLLNAGFPAVLAMQYRVPDDASIVFGRTFFEELFQGRSLERALQNARYALLVAGGRLERHFATPVLYLNQAAGGRLFKQGLSTVARALRPRDGKPFRYLESFVEDDAALFFGRDKAIEALVSRVANNLMLVVHGRSGIGKSSLLQAGFSQTAARGLYLPVPVRLLQDPVKALDDALERALQSGPSLSLLPVPVSKTATLSPLPSAAASRILQLNQRHGRTVLLILDQFEEFFTLVQPDARRTFLEVLQGLYRCRELKLRIVLVIREDFFFALDSLKEYFPTITHSTYGVQPLTIEEARSAFVSPLSALGIPHELELVDRVLADLRQDGYVDPVSLQIVGHRLFEQSRSRGEDGLTLQGYLELGGAEGILSLYLSDFIRSLPVADQGLAQQVLTQFVTREGTRKPATVGEICRTLGEESGRVLAVLRRLETGRLVRPVQSGGDPEKDTTGLHVRWELTHEVLITGVAKSRSGISRLGYDLEVRDLQRRLRESVVVTAVLSALLILALGLLVRWAHQSYGLMMRIELPSRGNWTLRLYPGQEQCDGMNARPVVWTVDDASIASWSFPRVGTYEARVTGPDREELRFPVRITGLGWERVRARPSLRFDAVPGLEMVYVAAGPAWLGLDPSFKLMMGNEQRYRDVPAFYISRHEVTRGQFRRFVGATGYKTSAERGQTCWSLSSEGKGLTAKNVSWRDVDAGEGGDDGTVDRLPVANVALEDAQAFTKWLSATTGHAFRLPNEDQWEKAARGLDQRGYPWGGCFTFSGRWANLENRGSYADAFPGLAPVASFPDGRSPYGLYDMAGNVFELTASCYTPAPNGGEGAYVVAPAGKCTHVSARGGGYRTPWNEITTSFPAIMDIWECAHNVGFRVVMEVATDGWTASGQPAADAVEHGL